MAAELVDNIQVTYELLVAIEIVDPAVFGVAKADLAIEHLGVEVLHGETKKGWQTRGRRRSASEWRVGRQRLVEVLPVESSQERRSADAELHLKSEAKNWQDLRLRGGEIALRAGRKEHVVCRSQEES